MASLQAEKIFDIGPLPVTNSFITATIVTIIICFIAFEYNKKSSIIPNKFTGFIEWVVEYLYSTIENISGDKVKKFFPLCASFFIFIIINSWFGLLPIAGPIGITSNNGDLIPLFRSINSDLNGTLVLALISLFATHIFAIQSVGIYNHLSRYLPFLALRTKDFSSPKKILITLLNGVLNMFIGLLELVSEFVKIISLSFRLFGNIYAGEIVLGTISSLLAFIAPLPFIGLEILVGYVQATVFMLLTVVFMTILTEKHESHSENH